MVDDDKSSSKIRKQKGKAMAGGNNTKSILYSDLFSKLAEEKPKELKTPHRKKPKTKNGQYTGRKKEKRKEGVMSLK